MRLYRGGYGHSPSGKLYTYRGGDNFRTGQRVRVKAWNKRANREVETMFTIMQTLGFETQRANDERGRLLRMGVGIKKILDTDVLQLPSGRLYETKKAWAESSEARRRAATERLLGIKLSPKNSGAERLKNAK